MPHWQGQNKPMISHSLTYQKWATYASKVGHLCTESDKVIISSEALPS